MLARGDGEGGWREIACPVELREERLLLAASTGRLDCSLEVMERVAGVA